MAFFDSKSSIFKIDKTAGGTLQDISIYINEISGLPGARGLNDVTALSDTGRKYQPGIYEGTITLAGHYDSTSTTGTDAIFGPLRDATVTLSFEYFPDGTQKYYGECWIDDYSVSTSVGSQVAFSVSLKVNGVVTRS